MYPIPQPQTSPALAAGDYVELSFGPFLLPPSSFQISIEKKLICIFFIKILNAED